MVRAVVLLAACAMPASAQVTSPPTAQVSLQFSRLWARGDNGTVQGVGGSGMTLRLGVRPLSPRSRLWAEGAITYIPGSSPSVWAANVGALYSLAAIGDTSAWFNPFATLAVGAVAYHGPPDDPSDCRSEEGCLDESPDLHGTKPSLTIGGGSWITLYPRLTIRLDLRAHHRFGANSNDAEDAWSPEFSAGLAYHFSY
jgi:hypothetical protein